MARIYKQPSIVSGKSIQDILNMDIHTFSNLNESDMRKVVSRLVSAGNKRLRSFENAKESSPATRYIMKKSGGYFSTKGKNLNALRSEYMRAKSFLEAKTGTRKGWNEVKEQTLATLKEKKGIELTNEQWDDFWNSYEELKELSPEVSMKKLKYSTLKELADMTTDTSKSADEIAIELHEKINDIYEKREELEYDRGISEFFKLDDYI